MARWKKVIYTSLLSLTILSFIAIGIPIGMIIAYWNDLPSLHPLEYETQSWNYPTKIYSDTFRVYPGISLKNLAKRLERLEYEKAQGLPIFRGQFYLREPVENADNEMRLYLRELNYPRLTLPSRLITVQIKGGKIAEIRNVDGTSMNDFILEPEVIAEFYGSEGIDRELVSLSQIPETVSNAFIAIEDKRFYNHFGFDLHRIFGAFWWNFRYSRKYRRVQGASTITQQLARDLFLTREQLWTRKIKEALLAVRIEKIYTKDEILERYLNRINLGRYGPREIYGVVEAARYYFGKNLRDLNIQECATLAAIPRDQSRYSPIRNPENSHRRRQVVLRTMLEEGFITESQYQEAAASPLDTVSSDGRVSNRDLMYFLEYLRTQLNYEPSALYRRGLRIYTTLDMSMQNAAASAIQSWLRVLDSTLAFPPYEENKAKWDAGERGKGVRQPESYLQSALVSIDPSTGYLKALVGGRDFFVGQWNRAVQSRRSPGSAFKPFVFAAAFANRLATPRTVIVDEPWKIEVPGGFWEPRNFGERFHGQVTVRKMCEESINVATARLLNEKVGVNKVTDVARAMGIRSPMDPVPSLALGSSGVSVMEITSAYGVLANGGIRAEPVIVKYVLDMEGNILEENTPPTRRVLDENVAFLVTYLMEGVVKQGTGQDIRKLGFNRPAAGKTGTTNDETDAWFIGFVPGLATGVWVGFDDYSRSVHRTGSKAALPIWANFMKSVVDGPVRDFPEPDGVVFTEVDADTGLLPTSGSTNVIKEAFLKGTEPTRY